MKKLALIFAASAVAGYFLAPTLVKYPPFTQAARLGAGTPAA